MRQHEKVRQGGEKRGDSMVSLKQLREYFCEVCSTSAFKKNQFGNPFGDIKCNAIMMYIIMVIGHSPALQH